MSFEKLKLNRENLVIAKSKPSTKGVRTPLSADAQDTHLYELFDLVKQTFWRNVHNTKVKFQRQNRTHYIYDIVDCASVHVWVKPGSELHIAVHPYEDAKYLEAVANQACRHVVTTVTATYPQYTNLSQYVVV